MPCPPGAFSLLATCMAGYSGTPLLKKLGIKEGIVLYIFKNPPDYFDWLSPLPPDIKVMNTLKSEVDFIHSFLTESKVFKTEFVKYKKHLKKMERFGFPGLKNLPKYPPTWMKI